MVSIESFAEETDSNFTHARRFTRLKSFTGITDGESISSHSPEFQLGQNYPNPFNPTTTIEYLVPKTVLVQLEIYNTAGQVVKTLVNEVKASGSHCVIWDGINETGAQVASGIYLYQVKAKNCQFTNKMIILK